MSQRLAIWMVEKLQDSMTAHAFRDKISELVQENAKLANDVYEDVFSKEVREKMMSLPDGWLPMESVVGVQFGESNRGYVSLKLDGTTNIYRDLTKLQLSDEPEVRRLFPYSKRSSCLKVYELEHPLAVKYEDLCSRLQDLKKSVEDARRMIKSTCFGYTTTGALCKAWPEAEPFLAAFTKVEPRSLPTVPRAKLNAILDLPVTGSEVLEEVT